MTKLYVRADTPELKREIVERLLTAWEKAPMLRLGQLIENCINLQGMFYKEDFPFIEEIEHEIERWT